MATSPDWDSRIGRRVRLRDLHILFAVAQHGSMGKAGLYLGMTQSAVSQAIAGLEHAIGTPLLDRTSRGAELTVYGAALVQRAQAAFDELRSGIKDIESLTDPASGEVRIACTESIAAGILPSAIERFAARHPRVQLHVFQTTTHIMGFAALHERKADVVVTLLPKPFEADLSEPLVTPAQNQPRRVGGRAAYLTVPRHARRSSHHRGVPCSRNHHATGCRHHVLGTSTKYSHRARPFRCGVTQLGPVVRASRRFSQRVGGRSAAARMASPHRDAQEPNLATRCRTIRRVPEADRRTKGVSSQLNSHLP